jgi:hypothetical protein
MIFGIVGVDARGRRVMVMIASVMIGVWVSHIAQNASPDARNDPSPGSSSPDAFIVSGDLVPWFALLATARQECSVVGATGQVSA